MTGAPAGAARPERTESQPTLPDTQTPIRTITLDEYTSLDIDTSVNGKPAVATIDCGCTGILVSEEFVKRHCMKTQQGPEKRLQYAEGTVTYSNQYIHADVQIGPVQQTLQMLVAPITTDVLLGLRWLRKSNPRIDWHSGTFMLDDHRIETKAKAGAVGSKVLETSTEGVEWISEKQLIKSLRKVELCYKAVLAETEQVRLTLEELGDSESSNSNQDHDVRGGRYSKVLDEFADIIPEKLPPVEILKARSHGVTHEIRLEDGARPHAQPIYHLSEMELAELRRQLKELLEAGHIRPSKSPWGAPVLFVRRKGQTSCGCASTSDG